MKEIGYDVIGMVKKTPKMFFRYNGDDMSLISIYNHSLGELFLYFSDEMSDITWIQAFQMLLQMLRTILYDTVELSEETIDELVDAFMSTIPTVLKSRLQAA